MNIFSSKTKTRIYMLHIWCLDNPAMCLRTKGYSLIQLFLSDEESVVC